MIPVQGQVWEISFDFVLVKEVARTTNLLQFTINNLQSPIDDTQIPKIIIYKRNITVQINRDEKIMVSLGQHEVNLGQKYRLVVRQMSNTGQNRRIKMATINDASIGVRTDLYNKAFKNVNCFLGNPWEPPAPVVISNLRYTEDLLYPGKGNPFFYFLFFLFYI